MVAQALKIEDEGIFQEVGEVTAREGSALTLNSASGTFHAERAFSCLIEPEIGDRVLFAGSQAGGLFVLAVLTRESDAPPKLAVEGDLHVGLKGGRFVVAAKDGIDLITPEEAAITAGSLRVHANEGHLFLDTLSHLGSQVVSEVKKVKLISGIFDSVIDRVSARVKRSYRTVEEIDQLRAEQIDYKAEQNVRIRGKNALVTAEKLVKMDADQIHLG
jgi:hypothetical protein